MIAQKLNELSFLRHAIRDFERERDRVVKEAYKSCTESTAELRRQATELERELAEYGRKNLPDGKKSIRYENGIISFRAQRPKYYFGDEEASASDARLIAFVKASAPEYLQVTERVDWLKFKSKLGYFADKVVYTDTGEVIDGLRPELQPDSCTIQTA